MKIKLKTLLCCSLAILMLTPSMSTVSASGESSVPTSGMWMSGEYHTHTTQSSDASSFFMTLENVLNGAFREELEQMPSETLTSLMYGDPFDFLVLTDHLRNSPRDPNGNMKPTARWKALKINRTSLFN